MRLEGTDWLYRDRGQRTKDTGQTGQTKDHCTEIRASRGGLNKEIGQKTKTRSDSIRQIRAKEGSGDGAKRRKQDKDQTAIRQKRQEEAPRWRQGLGVNRSPYSRITVGLAPKECFCGDNQLNGEKKGSYSLNHRCLDKVNKSF